MTFEEMLKRAEQIHSSVIALTLALEAADDHNREPAEFVGAARMIDEALADLTEAMAVAQAEHRIDLG